MQNHILEPTGLAKPGETRGLTGTGPGLARQESAGRVFELVWNRTDIYLKSNMGPLAGYPDPLLTQEAAKSPKTVSVVHIYIVKARSVLRFRKRQVQRIRWILHAPDSQMLPFASKYAINARIRG
jgi:hypothetical protein